MQLLLHSMMPWNHQQIKLGVTTQGSHTRTGNDKWRMNHWNGLNSVSNARKSRQTFIVLLKDITSWLSSSDVGGSFSIFDPKVSATDSSFFYTSLLTIMQRTSRQKLCRGLSLRKKPLSQQMSAQNGNLQSIAQQPTKRRRSHN